MNLLTINGYTPPAPSKYEVSFNDINGTDEQTEDGGRYKEQIRAQVPTISVGWTNLIESDATAIMQATQPALFECKYFFGTIITSTFSCNNPKIKLKLINGLEHYYDLDITLEA